MTKNMLKSTEFFLLMLVIFLFVVIGSINSAFFTIGNMYDLIRSSIVPGIFVMCAMIVIISGGIDVSFPAIATFSMFSTTKILHSIDYQGSIIWAFLIAAVIGLVLGLINAIFVSIFNLPTLIVTLGTTSMFSGFLLTFVGGNQISDLPPAMVAFSKVQILKITNESGITKGIPLAVVITLGIILIVAFTLRYTIIGRGIYAMGGDPVSAQRAGFSIRFLQFFVYSFAGTMAGIAGLIHTTMMRNSNPVDLLGGELLIIAAVVLGGTRITGGHGTVIGALLGLIIVITIQNNLILMGIPSYWQRFVIGILIIIGTGIAAIQVKQSLKKKKSIVT